MTQQMKRLAIAIMLFAGLVCANGALAETTASKNEAIAQDMKMVDRGHRPTMPWFNLNAMEEQDLKAIYQFIRHLGPVGEPAPVYVPPDQEPKTPYALFPTPPK